MELAGELVLSVFAAFHSLEFYVQLRLRRLTARVDGFDRSCSDFLQILQRLLHSFLLLPPSIIFAEKRRSAARVKKKDKRYFASGRMVFNKFYFVKVNMLCQT